MTDEDPPDGLDALTGDALMREMVKHLRAQGRAMRSVVAKQDRMTLGLSWLWKVVGAGFGLITLATSVLSLLKK